MVRSFIVSQWRRKDKGPETDEPRCHFTAVKSPALTSSILTSPTGGRRGGLAKETRIKLMIIRSSQAPNLLNWTSCQPFL